MPPQLPSSLFMHELARKWAEIEAEKQSYADAASTVGALGREQFGQNAEQAKALGAMLAGQGRPASDAPDLPGRLAEMLGITHATETSAMQAAAAEKARQARLLLQKLGMEQEARIAQEELKQYEAGRRQTKKLTAEEPLRKAQTYEARAAGKHNLTHPHYPPVAGGFGGPTAKSAAFGAIERQITKEIQRMQSGTTIGGLRNLPTGETVQSAKELGDHYTQMLQDLNLTRLTSGENWQEEIANWISRYPEWQKIQALQQPQNVVEKMGNLPLDPLNPDEEDEYSNR